MAKEIIWTPRAEKTFNAVIAYLEKEWTEKEVKKFISETSRVIKLISEKPETFRKSIQIYIREAVITKHNLLIYRIKGENIFLLSFWATRKNPKKKKIK